MLRSPEKKWLKRQEVTEPSQRQRPATESTGRHAHFSIAEDAILFLSQGPTTVVTLSAKVQYIHTRYIIMAEVQSPPMHEATKPRPIPERSALQIPPPSSVTLPPHTSASRIRNSHLNLDTFSPVNQNGSFEFDRVLKSGYVQKRTRKTKVDSQRQSGRRRIPTDKTCRLGSRFTSFCDPTPSPYTRIRRRISYGIRYICLT